TMVMPMAIAQHDTGGATQVLNPVKLPRAASELGENADALARKSERRRARGSWLFVLVLLLTALAAGTGWYFGAGPGSQVLVTDVSGMEPAAARDALAAQDLQVADETLDDFDPDAPIGTVVRTEPASGTAVAHGAPI